MLAIATLPEMERPGRSVARPVPGQIAHRNPLGGTEVCRDDTYQLFGFQAVTYSPVIRRLDFFG
jgi:hypothetical protein